MSAPIRIASAPSQAPLSAAQKKFNSLVQRIAAQREQLQAWDGAVAAYRERHAREFLPLIDEYHGLHVELLQLLDGMAGRKLSKADRALLDELIAGMASSMASGARDDATREAMKTLYNRYAGGDYETDMAEADAEAERMAKEMARELFGLDMDGVDFDSPEDVARRVEEQLQAAQEHAEQQRAAHQAKRRKKPSAREQKQQLEAKQASQSVRALYRKLASSLHPDREADPTERERKTALMQRANQAYEAGNLLDLLQLQWEAEQIDPAKLASFSDERLKHYNRVLTEQLAELKHEVDGAEMAFTSEFGLPPAQRLKPARLQALLRTQMQQLQMDLYRLRLFMRELQSDPAELKRWLKREQQSARERDMLPDGVFEELFR